MLVKLYVMIIALGNVIQIVDLGVLKDVKMDVWVVIIHV
jgi:hypothetical protein